MWCLLIDLFVRISNEFNTWNYYPENLQNVCLLWQLLDQFHRCCCTGRQSMRYDQDFFQCCTATTASQHVYIESVSAACLVLCVMQHSFFFFFLINAAVYTAHV